MRLRTRLPGIGARGAGDAGVVMVARGIATTDEATG